MKLIKQSHESVNDKHRAYLTDEGYSLYYSARTKQFNLYSNSPAFRNFITRAITEGKWIKL